MRKLFLLSLLLPLALLAPKALAQDYSYDCLCLYSEPNGTCVEYTCDAYSRNARYYQEGYGCDTRYDRSCNYGSTSRRRTYRPTYRTEPNYNSSGNYYDSRYDYDWYYRRYTGRSNNNNNYYDRSYYDTPYYY